MCSAKRIPERAGQRVDQFGHRVQGAVVERLAGPPPQHRAQLVLDVQAQPVVDTVNAAVDTAKHVAALAVSVVDQHVEHRHPPKSNVVGVNQRDRLAGIVIRPQHRQIAGRQPVSRNQVDRVWSGPRV